MNVAAVFAGLKASVEANGYTVTNSPALMPGQCMIYQTGVEVGYEENASRHTGEFSIIMCDALKPNQRLTSESAAATRVEVLLNALKDVFTSFAIILEITGARTELTEEDHRITTVTLTALYAV